MTQVPEEALVDSADHLPLPLTVRLGWLAPCLNICELQNLSLSATYLGLFLKPLWVSLRELEVPGAGVV